MFTTNLADYKIKQDEMIRQAEAYRLAKLAAGSNDLITSIVNIIRKAFSSAGQGQLRLSTAK